MVATRSGPGSITGTVIEVLKVLNNLREKTISEEEAQSEMARLLREGVKAVATAAGAAAPVIDVSFEEGTEGPAEQTQGDGAAPEGKKKVGFVPFFRAALNLAVHDTTEGLGIGFLGDFLNTDIRSFFGLPTEDSALTLGAESLGALLGTHIPVPMGPTIGAQLGKLIGALTERALESVNAQAVLEAEFSVENLRLMQEFGVRQAEVYALAERYFEESAAFDARWREATLENERAAQAARDAIQALGEDTREAINRLKGRP